MIYKKKRFYCSGRTFKRDHKICGKKFFFFLISKSIKRGFQCALFCFFNQKSKNAATMKRLVIYGPGVLLPEIYDFYAFKNDVFPISPKGIEARLSSSLSWYVKVSCRLETIFYYYFIEWKTWMATMREMVDLSLS